MMGDCLPVPSLAALICATDSASVGFYKATISRRIVRAGLLIVESRAAFKVERDRL
jgi:hypothetical protein